MRYFGKMGKLLSVREATRVFSLLLIFFFGIRNLKGPLSNASKAKYHKDGTENVIEQPKLDHKARLSKIGE